MPLFARGKSAEVPIKSIAECLVRCPTDPEIPSLLPGIPDFTYSKVYMLDTSTG
jgi:hypothetical protein